MDSFYWIGLGVCTLIAIVGWLLRNMLQKIWTAMEERLKKIEDWKHDLECEGGTVTRDLHFRWCGESSSKCGGPIRGRLSNLEEWRQDLGTQGGPLVMDKHTDICERVSARVAATLGQKFSDELRHERELFQKELQVIQLTLEKQVIELRALRKANGLE